MTRPVRILLVEDNPADVLLPRETLRQQSLAFTLQHYSDGEEAAKAIAGIPVCPDLILRDINIPRIQGFDLLTLVRGGYGHSDHCHVHVVADRRGPKESRAVGS